MKKKIINIIYDTIDEVNKENPDGILLTKSLDTVIIEDEGILDSLGIINYDTKIKNL